jgi:hypothetical protein
MADFVYGGNTVDRSGTITTGGTAQQLAPARQGRRGYSIQNQSTGDLWVRALGNREAAIANAAATQPSRKIPAGAYYETPPFGAPEGPISIYGATTGQAFQAEEW